VFLTWSLGVIGMVTRCSWHDHQVFLALTLTDLNLPRRLSVPYILHDQILNPMCRTQ